jgi:nicotinate-nucleotide adenylyltransferase
MRLGIFGGTFDPVHIAHLRCAEEAREVLGLDRVVFIPAAAPPHKRHQPVAAAAHRLAMLRLALAGNRAFRASALELERSGPSYSVDTVRRLRTELPAGTRMVFLLGLDAFRDIHTWKEHRVLLAMADFAIFARPGYQMRTLRSVLPVATRRDFCYGANQQTLRHQSGSQVRFLNLTALDISASAIRQRVTRGQSIRYLVPLRVERYIARHRLYRGL